MDGDGNDARQKEAAELYQQGWSCRAVAAKFEVSEDRARAWIRGEGVTMRPRGRQRSLDPETVSKVIEGRDKHRMSWERVARFAGVSKTGAMKAYQSRTGRSGDIQHYATLSRLQIAELQGLLDRVPLGEGLHGGTRNRERQLLTSPEGREFVERCRAHHSVGVPYSHMARELGLRADSLSRVCRAITENRYASRTRPPQRPEFRYGLT